MPKIRDYVREGGDREMEFVKWKHKGSCSIETVLYLDYSGEYIKLNIR